VGSGGVETEEGIISEDAIFFKACLNTSESLRRLNPFCLREPLAPGVACRRERQEVDLAEIQELATKLFQKYEVVLFEGVGGLYVPITSSFLTNIDLIKRLNLLVIIVARAGLGTINHTLLTLRVLKEEKIPVLGIIINGYDNSLAAQTNLEILPELISVPILGVLPWLKEIKVNPPQVTSEAERVFKEIISKLGI
jgi:dethiobiotin synthetase